MEVFMNRYSAKLKIGGTELHTDNFRVMQARGPRDTITGWRWALTDKIDGFSIVKRSTVQSPTEQKAIDDAEKQGIEIVYPGV